jgi:hypothetical protein
VRASTPGSLWRDESAALPAIPIYESAAFQDLAGGFTQETPVRRVVSCDLFPNCGPSRVFCADSAFFCGKSPLPRPVLADGERKTVPQPGTTVAALAPRGLSLSPRAPPEAKTGRTVSYARGTSWSIESRERQSSSNRRHDG